MMALTDEDKAWLTESLFNLKDHTEKRIHSAEQRLLKGFANYSIGSARTSKLADAGSAARIAELERQLAELQTRLQKLEGK